LSALLTLIIGWNYSGTGLPMIGSFLHGINIINTILSVILAIPFVCLFLYLLFNGEFGWLILVAILGSISGYLLLDTFILSGLIVFCMFILISLFPSIAIIFKNFKNKPDISNVDISTFTIVEPPRRSPL